MVDAAIDMDVHATEPPPRTARLAGILFVILLLALAVRVYRAGTLGSISRDGVFLVTFAKQIGEDPAFYIRTQTKQPGYSAMLLGLHKLIGPRIATESPLQWERCGQALSILGGLVGVGMIIVITRRLFSIDTAVVAGAVAAFWPNQVAVSADVLTDAPHLGLYLVALWIGGSALDRKTPWISLTACGVISGLAYWMRQEALGVPLAVAAVLVMSRAEYSRRQRLIGCACLFGAFAAVVSPLVVITGSLMHNKSIWEMLTGPHAEVVLAPDTLVVAETVTPWTAPVHIFLAWCASGRYVISTWALIALAWPAVRPAHARWARLVAIAILLQLVATQLRGGRHGEISQRYLMIPVALSIPWAAEAMRQAAIALRRMMHGRSPQLIRFAPVFGTPRRRASWAGLCILAVFMSPMIWYGIRPAPAGADAPRQAGRWLAEHAGIGDRILTPRELSPVAFYAGLPHEWPFDSINQPVGVQPTKWFVDRTNASALPPEQAAFLESIRSRLANRAPEATFSLPGADAIKVFKSPPYK